MDFNWNVDIQWVLVDGLSLAWRAQFRSSTGMGPDSIYTDDGRHVVYGTTSFHYSSAHPRPIFLPHKSTPQHRLSSGMVRPTPRVISMSLTSDASCKHGMEYRATPYIQVSLANSHSTRIRIDPIVTHMVARSHRSRWYGHLTLVLVPLALNMQKEVYGQSLGIPHEFPSDLSREIV